MRNKKKIFVCFMVLLISFAIGAGYWLVHSEEQLEEEGKETIDHRKNEPDTKYPKELQDDEEQKGESKTESKTEWNQGDQGNADVYERKSNQTDQESDSEDMEAPANTETGWGPLS